jgi:DNA-binding PadR family transcriptional regulator
MTEQMVLLSILHRGPANLLELAMAYRGWFPLPEDRVLPRVDQALHDLVQDGFVARSAGSSTDVQGDMVQQTESGREAVLRWLQTFEGPITDLSDELVRKTVAALNIGEEGTRFLNGQRNALWATMHGLTRERETTTDLGRRLLIERLLGHLEADLHWLDEARRQAEGLRTP